MDNKKNNGVDIAILTSIPIEVLAALKIYNKNYQDYKGFSAFARKPDFIEDIRAGLTPKVFFHGFIDSRDRTKRYSVLISKLSQYGGMHISSLVTDIYNFCNPNYFFLIGIAMGFDESQVALGDLVLADKVICVTANKQEYDKAHPQFKIHQLHDKNSSWKTKIFNRIGEKVLIVDGEERTQRSFVGSFYSSFNLIASDEYKKEITDRFGEITSGEMEILGILEGANETIKDIKSKLFVAKGISDHGGNDKKDTSDRYAAALHAAEFVEDVIKEGLLQPKNGNFFPDDKSYEKLLSTEFLNWLGEMQFSQGLFDKAADSFQRAWNNIVVDKKDYMDVYRKEFIVRISQNISRIDTERGRLANALNKAMISLIGSKSFSDLHAESLYITGRALRDAELLKTCDEFFQAAKNEFISLNNSLGVIKTQLWIGYTKYKFGEFEKAYEDIFESLNTYEDFITENNGDRLVVSEIYDMLGRCLREIAKHYTNDKCKDIFFRINKRNLCQVENVDISGKTLCILEALYFFWVGMKNAEKEGNYYRLAESYLSYVILLSYEDVRVILQQIIENWLDYSQKHKIILDIRDDKKRITIPNSKEDGQIPEYINYLKEDFEQSIYENYQKGIKLAIDWKYNLLLCLFEKHMGDFFFSMNNYDKAFEKYAKRFEYATKNFIEGSSFQVQQLINDKLEDSPNQVRIDPIYLDIIRPTEKYRSFSEISEKCLSLSDEELRAYLTYLKHNINIDNSNLFSTDYFSALLDE